MNRLKFVKKVLKPAIRSKTCPICLCHVSEQLGAVISPCLHAYCVDCIERWSKIKTKCPLCNCGFKTWFYRIEFSLGTFSERLLENRARVHRPLAVGRVVRRWREEFNCSNQRSRPLPRRRLFTKPGPESSDALTQRVLQWRTSIYEQRLQAVPHGSNLQVNTTRNSGVKERISRRIEPWIHRELKAILGDPDPSIIVHLASSLFISSLDTNDNQSLIEDRYLDPLRPFTHGLTNMFWHELRCFAGSPFNMETYDTVVEYRKMNE